MIEDRLDIICNVVDDSASMVLSDGRLSFYSVKIAKCYVRLTAVLGLILTIQQQLSNARLSFYFVKAKILRLAAAVLGVPLMIPQQPCDGRLSFYSANDKML